MFFAYEVDTVRWQLVAEIAAPLIEWCRINNRVREPCETPIERFFAAAFLRQNPDFLFTKTRDVPTRNSVLIAQFEWRNYRIDFALRHGKNMIFIECDGAAFHSLPKDVARDKRKDARAGAAGIQVLRFTGKELNRNSDFCAWLAYYAVMGLT